MVSRNCSARVLCIIYKSRCEGRNALVVNLDVDADLSRPSPPPPSARIQRTDTNMNQFNQVTVPQLAFMNAIMTALQTQPQQAQLQSAGGVPNAINGPTMPQQPAAFPNFLLQVPQLQAIPQPGPSSVPQLPVGAQPWVLSALNTENAQQPSGSQSAAGPAPKQPTAVDEIVAGVVAAMKSRVSQEEVPEKALARFTSDDERVLINALRKAKAEGLSPLHCISKLDQVSRLTLSFSQA